MATTAFATTAAQLFQPVSTALQDFSNGSGTVIALAQLPDTSGSDLAGVFGYTTAITNWYHMLGKSNGDELWDDDGVVGTSAVSVIGTVANHWYLCALDFPGSGSAHTRFHHRDLTAAGSWTHVDANGNNGGFRAGPGATAAILCGYGGDFAGAKNMAAVAMWKGIRFADSDYGLWTKTSDLIHHPLGSPSFATEFNTLTPFDLMGLSTYSVAKSFGTRTLTGGDPDNWTLDGLGSTPFTAAKPRIVGQSVQRAAVR